MGDALLGFIGVLLGASTALFGTLYTTKAERKRQADERRRRVRTAARAWREDFYAVQSALVERLRDSGSTADLPESVATDDHLLILADEFKGYGSWTRVTATRRRILRARQRYADMTPSEVAKLFVDVEKGRQAVSSVDSDWPFSPHPHLEVVRPHVPSDVDLRDPADVYDKEGG